MSLIDPTTFETLADQTLAQFQQYQRERAQQKLQAEQEQQQAAEQELLARLKPLLPTFLETVTLTSPLFSYLDQDWHIRDEGNGRWALYLTRPGQSYSTGRLLASSVQSELLETQIFYEIGKERARLKQKETEEEERLRAHQEIHAIEAQHRQRREQQRAERIAAADQEHARLTQLTQEAIAQATRDLWHWPEGTRITLYLFSYCRGAIRDEDGSASFDYDGGWTTSPSLDAQQRIRLESSQHQEKRTLRFIQDQDHLMPERTWEEHVFSSLPSLPRELRNRVYARLSDVYTYQDSAELDAKTRLVETTTPTYGMHSWEEEIGEEPLPWLKTYIDEVAASGA